MDNGIIASNNDVNKRFHYLLVKMNQDYRIGFGNKIVLASFSLKKLHTTRGLHV